MSQTFSDTMEKDKLSIAALQRKRGSLERQIEVSVNDALYMYGIKVSNFSINEFNLPETYTNILNKQAEGIAERKRLAQLGIDYTDNRRLDIMEGVAKNQGSGTISAAGFGVQMASGAGPNLGSFMQQTAVKALPPTPPPLPLYHFVIGGSVAGPYSLADIRALVAAGNITSGSLYWSSGMQQWQEVSGSATLRSLFSSL